MAKTSTVRIQIIIFILISSSPFTFARRLPILYWNSSNPIFTDSTRFPSSLDVESGAAYMEVDSMDILDIVCPHSTVHDPAQSVERLIIHQVSDLSFMSCQLDSRSLVLQVCDSPQLRLSRSLLFSASSSSMSHLEYLPGRSYYLITTSNGSSDGLHNTRRGLCKSKNLRLQIYVRPLQELNSPSRLDEGKMPSGVEHKPSRHIQNAEGDGINNAINPKFDAISTSNNPYSRQSGNADGTQFRLDGHPKKNSGRTEVNGNIPNRESRLFAAKHGIDLDSLEYVRQLARTGTEGDFSFHELDTNRKGAAVRKGMARSPSVTQSVSSDSRISHRRGSSTNSKDENEANENGKVDQNSGWDQTEKETLLDDSLGNILPDSTDSELQGIAFLRDTSGADLEQLDYLVDEVTRASHAYRRRASFHFISFTLTYLLGIYT
ncbi:hypothetical protein AB6A40_002195 [Gnathostoma spinigerum]|uniref:Ephrin RBD domain-containing protein n=1 Tax=Gnathostoma spinigerum TaxID=75299 RepID=A0ABD6E7A1_9BILA